MEPAPVRLAPPLPGERDAYLAAAFADMADGILFARFPERVILDANPALLRMLGYARDDLVGRSTGVLHVDDARFAAFGDLVRPAFERGESVRVEWPMRRRDGTVLTADVTVTPLAPHGGASTGVVCVLRDVGGTQRAEEERHQAQRLLEAVLSQMPSGVVVSDARGRVVRANGRMEALAGRPGRFDLPDVAAYAEWEGWRPDGSPIAPHEWPLSRALATGETVTGELLRVRTGQGRDAWCRVGAAPVRDAEGRIVAGVAIVEDVTRELDALASVQAQRQRLETLVAALAEMGDALLLTVGPRIEWANDAFLRLLGVTREELMAPGFDPTRFVPPEDRAALLARGAERLSGRRLHEHYEMSIQRRDGAVVPVEVSARGEPTPEGVRVTAVLRDVTERRRQREELELARAQLARSEKLSALGSLVAGVAHELRTPLTYLATNLDLVERGVERVLADLPPERLDAARARLAPRLMDAREGMDRINRLVEDLRKFTKLREAGDMLEMDLAPIVDEAVGLFRATHRSDVRVIDELRPTPVRLLDRVQLQQVVLNLMENAREARPRDGAIRVRTYADAEGRPVLEVEDKGPGIPPDVQARMWDPFFTTKPDGSGLGLAIVKRIADAHRAIVTCASQPGEGTTFRLTFR